MAYSQLVIAVSNESFKWIHWIITVNMCLRKYYAFMNSTPLTELDICYNIRYVELHGRNRKDPWSFRNLALHHSYSRTGESTWIFISLPVSIREHLKQLLDENEDYHHVLWHLDILVSTEKNWRWYINFLEDSQQKIVSLDLNT